jgi:hypothetical protein
MANHDVTRRSPPTHANDSESATGGIDGCPPDPLGAHVLVLLEEAARLWAQFGPQVMYDGEWIHQTDITSTLHKRFLWAAEAAWDEVAQAARA